MSVILSSFFIGGYRMSKRKPRLKLLRIWWALKRKRERRMVFCAWCQERIKPGSEITAYSLFYKAETEKMKNRKGVRYFSLSPKEPLVFIGCCRNDCPSNKDGVFVSGKLTVEGKIEINQEIERRYLIRY